MRDDNHPKSYRPNEQYRQPPAGGANVQGGDPLAELARLIGQNDPFSDFGRAPAPANNPPARRAAEASPSDWQAQPDSHRDHPQARPAPHAAPTHGDYRGGPAGPNVYSEPYSDGAAADEQYASPDYAAAAHDSNPQRYADPRYGALYGEPHGYQQQLNSFPQPRGRQDYGSDPYYRGMPHDEEMYEDHRPAPRRGGGLLTVMAVLALAVVGTAAAFGYRAVFSNAGSALTPPTIRADAGPNKVVPATQSGDAASNKLIYDRVGDKSGTERVVSREEQPVDLKNAAPPPRVVLSSGMANPIAPVPNTPAPPSAPASAGPSSPAALAAPANVANASTEPKKVRTLTIRPDQPVAVADPAGARSAVAPAPVPARTAAAEDPPPVSTAVRTTTIRQQPQQTAQSDPNAPLSLTPNSSAQRGTMRTASAPAARPIATTSGDSAYSVQVTSQRSEAEAQSSFQALQAKYPSVLGNRQATIRRADLGDKGTYYRAQVPFGSQGEASEFCASLKAAGGQCVVQRN
jgi:hypothetical protein